MDFFFVCITNADQSDSNFSLPTWKYVYINKYIIGHMYVRGRFRLIYFKEVTYKRMMEKNN